MTVKQFVSDSLVGVAIGLVVAIVVLILTACSPQPSNGNDGATGPQGPKGDQGDPGQDLTPISFVQLCPSSVGSYPNVFPEIAMCIDHKLYGVYSANGGFLVFMPPGAYSSNGINSSCSFNVLPNCVLQ